MLRESTRNDRNEPDNYHLSSDYNWTEKVGANGLRSGVTKIAFSSTCEYHITTPFYVESCI